MLGIARSVFHQVPEVDIPPPVDPGFLAVVAEAFPMGDCPGATGLGSSFGCFGCSSGALPADRIVTILFRMSNQKGAPSEAAPAVSSSPKNFVSHHTQKFWLDGLPPPSQPRGMPVWLSAAIWV